jgi:hypothetical protein
MKNVLTLCLIMAVVVLVGCASNKAALPDKDEPNQI